MHRLLTPQAHALFDFPLGVAFVLAPVLGGFGGLPRWLSVAVGLIHLFVTWRSRPPRRAVGLTVREPLDFTVHGMLEVVVALAVAAAPWTLRFQRVVPARNFFVGAGVVLGLLWALTNYRAAPTRYDRTVWRTGRRV
jgi:hypothetical protein